MALHKNIQATENHIIHSLEYADQATREAASGFTSSDVGRVALQQDTGGFWILKNPSPATWYELTDTSGGWITASGHSTLRQLIHFIDNGPAEGFVSGAYRETTFSSGFIASIIWYEDGTKAKKIVERVFTRDGNQRILQDQWKMYGPNGTSVISTVTDNVVHSGIYETSRTRTIA